MIERFASRQSGAALIELAFLVPAIFSVIVFLCTIYYLENLRSDLTVLAHEYALDAFQQCADESAALTPNCISTIYSSDHASTMLTSSKVVLTLARCDAAGVVTYYQSTAPFTSNYSLAYFQSGDPNQRLCEQGVITVAEVQTDLGAIGSIVAPLVNLLGVANISNGSMRVALEV